MKELKNKNSKLDLRPLLFYISDKK